jgi:hypothetical protein
MLVNRSQEYDRKFNLILRWCSCAGEEALHPIRSPDTRRRATLNSEATGVTVVQPQHHTRRAIQPD